MLREVLFASLLLPFAAVAQRSVGAEEACFKLASHAEARECLVARAEQSDRAVREAEAQAVEALQRWDQEPPFKKHSVDALRRSATEYRRMRAAQCQFQSTLASGGNAAGDRRLLCQVELDQRRVAELQAAAASLQ